MSAFTEVVSYPDAPSRHGTHYYPGSEPACEGTIPLMGLPDHGRAIGIMGGPDRGARLDVMAGPDGGVRLDVMGGPDPAWRLDLMGRSDARSVDSLFTGRFAAHDKSRVTRRRRSRTDRLTRIA